MIAAVAAVVAGLAAAGLPVTLVYRQAKPVARWRDWRAGRRDARDADARYACFLHRIVTRDKAAADAASYRAALRALAVCQ